MGRRGKITAGLAGLAAAAALALPLTLSQGGSVDVFVGSTPTAASTPDPCDLNATTGTLASQITAASDGDVICLATGDYGTFTGTSKAITLKQASGASVTMAFDLSNGDCCFTVDGFDDITSADIQASGGAYTFNSAQPHLILFENSTFTGVANIDHVVETQPHTWDYTVKFEGTTHNDISFNGGRIRLPYDDNTVDSGVIVDHVVMRNNEADGVNAGPGVTITNSEFDNIQEGAHPDYHSDPVQVFGRGTTQHTIITGNWIHDGADGIAIYDGVGNATITDNVINSDAVGRCLELYVDNAGTGSDPSTVAHNTLYGDCNIDLDKKTEQATPGSGTIVKDNIVPSGVAENNGSTAAVNTNNLFSGASSPNISGSATFTGGTTPTSYAGFCLTAGSDGHLAASDGLDVGIRC